MTSLERFEYAVDQAFASRPLPHPNGYVSAWYLLTVCEDSQRILLCMPGERLPEWRVDFYNDRFKFSLRSCLGRLYKESSDWSLLPLPQNVVPALYYRAQTLLFSGIDYSIASQICSSAHNNSIRILEDGENFQVELDDSLHDHSYAALEIMRQSSGEVVIPFSSLFWFWICEESRRPTVLWQISESTSLKNRHIRYHYHLDWAVELAQSMPQAPFLVPDEWVFPWGGRSETTLLLNAVSVRSLYHLVAIQFGAEKFKLKGGAEYDLCLVQTLYEWIADIELMSSLDPKKIEIFINYLTYGYKTRFPDQALQPFVPLGSKQLGLGPLSWLSSNVERNLLSLQTRIASNDFNDQSSLFERRMTDYLLEVIRAKWPLVVTNRTFALPDAKEEFDILICDPVTKTVVDLELRWMLPPADPREVQQKSTACWEKVDQAKRKANAARNGLSILLKAAFGLTDIIESDWSVYAMAVIEGYGGVKSQQSAIPVIPEWVFEAGVIAASNLRSLSEWAVSLAWLPVEGRDFEIESDATPHFDNVKLKYTGLIPLRTGRAYCEDATIDLNGDY